MPYRATMLGACAAMVALAATPIGAQPPTGAFLFSFDGRFKGIVV
jgi:hypothetical protein